MIAFCIIGFILMVIAQYCFTFKIWFNVELIGSLTFLISLILIIPFGIKIGWNKIWIYLLCLAGGFLVGLISSGLLFRYKSRKSFPEAFKKKDSVKQTIIFEEKRQEINGSPESVTKQKEEESKTGTDTKTAILKEVNVNTFEKRENDTNAQKNKKEIEFTVVKVPICSDQIETQKIADKAHEILVANNLLDNNGQSRIIRVFDQKDRIADAIYDFNMEQFDLLNTENVIVSEAIKQKFYGSFCTADVICNDSIKQAFYGSIILTLAYYQEPNDFINFDPTVFFRKRNRNPDDFKKYTEIGFEMIGSNNQTKKMESAISPFNEYVTNILKDILEKTDLDTLFENTVKCAAENAYVLGMQFAIKYQEQEAGLKNYSALENALKKLVLSAIHYKNPPERNNW